MTVSEGNTTDSDIEVYIYIYILGHAEVMLVVDLTSPTINAEKKNYQDTKILQQCCSNEFILSSA